MVSVTRTQSTHVVLNYKKNKIKEVFGQRLHHLNDAKLTKRIGIPGKHELKSANAQFTKMFYNELTTQYFQLTQKLYTICFLKLYC